MVDVGQVHNRTSLLALFFTWRVSQRTVVISLTFPFSIQIPALSPALSTLSRSSPPSVWYQSTPSSTRRSSSLSDSRLLKRCLETLSEVCFHLNSFSHGQRPSHTHWDTHTHIPPKPQLSRLWGYCEESEKHVRVWGMHSALISNR